MANPEPGKQTIADYTDLSLTGRLAVGLHCFTGYCHIRGLRHPSVDALLDDLWQFPLAIASPELFSEWEAEHPHLVDVGLGDEFSSEFRCALNDCGIPVNEFRQIVENLVDIVFASFYGASEDQQSLDSLRAVICTCLPPKPIYDARRFRPEL